MNQTSFMLAHSKTERLLKHLPAVGAVVLNWNRPQDTRLCIESLKASDYPALRIVIVDNGSDVDRYAELQSLTDVEIIRAETNLGFARGNNLGIHYMLEQGVNYVLLVNNDAIVDSQMVRQLVEVMEDNPSIGAAGPIIYYLDMPESVWFAGYRIKGTLYILRRGLHLKPPIKPVEYVDFISGCGMLLRRETLEQVGLFSPEYFMYYEDLDLCLRMKQAGWQIACVTGAKMWHAVSLSSGGVLSPVKQYHQVRSSLIFYRRYTRGIMFAVNLVLRFGHAAYSALVYILRNGLNISMVQRYFRGVIEGLLHAFHST